MESKKSAPETTQTHSATPPPSPGAATLQQSGTLSREAPISRENSSRRRASTRRADISCRLVLRLIPLICVFPLWSRLRQPSAPPVVPLVLLEKRTCHASPRQLLPLQPQRSQWTVSVFKMRNPNRTPPVCTGPGSVSCVQPPRRLGISPILEADMRSATKGCRNRRSSKASEKGRFGVILTSVITSLITALLVVWSSEALIETVPSPQRLVLSAQNALSATPSRADENFRIVLCWLENDWSGKETKNVEDAFTGVEGITLVVSAKKVAASGAADEWRPAMERRASAVLEEWNADLAIIGTVKRPGEALGLWFVPRRGDSTLTRGDRPYRLEEATLGADFHGDLQTQLAVMAWNAVAPLAETETRARVIEKGLRTATEKLSKLLIAPTIRKPEHRAALRVALGNALSTLGRREASPDRLERATVAYRKALTLYTRERAPLEWAKAQFSLGVALRELAARETGTERLEQAIAANQAALEVFTREQMPSHWAAVQGHLGTILRRLGEEGTGTARLEQAVGAHRAALEVFAREHAPYDWAIEKDHLGNALSSLGSRTNSTVVLEQALDAHRAALEVFTRDKVPLTWAATLHNVGTTLMIVGQRERGTSSLQQAVDAFRMALQERTRGRTPLLWAVTQNSLGKALYHLGERKHSRAHFEGARNAYLGALEVLESAGAPRHLEMAQNNLKEVVRKLRESGASAAAAR